MLLKSQNKLRQCSVFGYHAQCLGIIIICYKVLKAQWIFYDNLKIEVSV